MEQKKRYENIDFMKGVCILLVVATHLDLPILSHASFSLFRMPLYYFLSGIFFSRYDGFRTFLIKKTNNLIIPYLFFSIFTLVAILVFYFWKDWSLGEAYTESGPLHNGPIWFLVSLFEVGIIMYFVSAIKLKVLQFLVVLLLSLSGYYLCQKEIILPLYMNTALLGVFFYYSGLLLRRYSILDDVSHIGIKFVTLLVIFLLVAFVVIPDRRLALISYEIPFSYHWFIIAGLSGTLALFYFSKIVEKVSIINYFGRYSIIVLGVHWYFVKSWKYVILPPTDEMHKGLFLYVIYIIALLASLVCIILMKKYLPWFTAQKPLIKLPE
ncbi:MAG: acyltransferase family protein [Prevotella sp.]|jgi:fucose 4-O-acetylase-like acetyltransferase|nr:acyltransferase family protein [Prevotella sp.]